MREIAPAWDWDAVLYAAVTAAGAFQLVLLLALAVYPTLASTLAPQRAKQA